MASKQPWSQLAGGLCSLGQAAEARLPTDLIFTYKLVFGLIDAGLHDFLVPRFNEFRRGHDYKLYLPTCKLNIRSNSFDYRVLLRWNSLPSNTDFTSLKRFHKSFTPEVLLPYCKFFLFSWCVAYIQYNVFCIWYTCTNVYICMLNCDMYFMCSNVSGHLVILFNKLIDHLVERFVEEWSRFDHTSPVL